MNDKLTKRLFKKYPKIFRDNDKSPMQSLMCFGCDCGNGWYHILNALCAAITRPFRGSCVAEEEMSKWEKGEKTIGFKYVFPQVLATQVKEKYGRLVFYYSYENSKEFIRQSKRFPMTAKILNREFSSYIDGVIRMAEVMSEITCEECGNTGEMCVSGAWYQTLCSEHARKHGFIPIRKVKQSRRKYAAT